MCLSSLHMLRLLCLDRYELAMNLSFFCLLSWKYIIFKIELIAIRIWFGYQKWERQYCLQYISWCCKNGGWFFVNIGLEVCPFSVFFSSSFTLLIWSFFFWTTTLFMKLHSINFCSTSIVFRASIEEYKSWGLFKF